MSLEENLIRDSMNGEITITEFENRLTQICDEFAIGFNRWVNENAYKFPTKTTDLELLEIYKQGL